MGPGSAEPADGGAGGGGGRGEWHVTDEFRQRLGCGLGAAVALPAWFAVMALALGREVTGLAVVVATALFVVSVVLGVSAVRRLRALPSIVALDGDGWLRVSGRHVSLALPAEAVVEVEVGAAVGLESVRLHTRQGRTVRLPGDLDDLDGFLAALRRASPDMAVLDHRQAILNGGGEGPDGSPAGPPGAPGGGDGRPGDECGDVDDGNRDEKPGPV